MGTELCKNIFVPDSVRELCDRCFYRCTRLRSMTFGVSPSLERIGVDCFRSSSVAEVRTLCENIVIGAVMGGSR